MSETAQRKTWFAEHNDMLERLVNQAKIATDRLDAFTVRVVGPCPEAQDEPREEKPSPSGHLARADGLTVSLKETLERLEALVGNLWRLG